MRIRHWTCSKFADWLRGVEKPKALGWGDWEKWHEEARRAHPVRYFLAENLLRWVQKVVSFPSDCINRVRYWYHNRFVSKTHFLKTGLPPGYYYELDERILHGLFNELKWFVEVELAALQNYGDKKYEFKRGRCPEAGLDHLEWASGLVYDESSGATKTDPDYGAPTPQAQSAKVMRELYRWWEDRLQRPLHGFSLDEEDKADLEDERMLHILIGIRKSLWT